MRKKCYFPFLVIFAKALMQCRTYLFFLDEQKYHSELYGLLYIIGAEDKENIFLLKRIRM